MEDIILEKILNDVENENFIDIMLEEAIKSIPILKKLRSPMERRKLLENYGDCAFLDPFNLKYPIINPDSKLTNENINKISYDCSLLLRAYYELKAYEPQSDRLIDKAQQLLLNNSCPKIKIQFETIDETLDIDTLLFYLT